MKLKLITLALVMSLFIVNISNAKVERVKGGWNIQSTYFINFECVSGCTDIQVHVMVIDFFNKETGGFSGWGYYYDYPGGVIYAWWDMSGILTDGNRLAFILDYRNSDYEISGEGNINEDGTISGTAQSNEGEIFNWQNFSGRADRFTGNHGQYVKSQGSKSDAAHSRLGMPAQSKGHTK